MSISILPSQFSVLDTHSLLQGLSPHRPRFIATPDRMNAIRGHLATQPVAGQLLASLTAHADDLLAKPPLTDSSHGASRQILDRIVSLGLLFQLNQDARYGRRAVDELLASSRLSHWSPEAFLSIAERSLAFCIGLDWLTPTPSEREEIESALHTHSLLEYQKAYACLAWWHRDSCNWNIVCNSAAILTALTLHHAHPHIAEQVLASALTGLPNALATFAPDGGWPEGPGYWAFAMRFITTLLDALDTSLPELAAPLAAHPGLREAALFRLATEGPTHKLFNFADCYEEAPVDPSLFSLAARYHLPAVAYFTRQRLQRGHLPGYFGAHARGLLYFTPMGNAGDLDALPVATRFATHDVAAFRTSWSDPQPVYLACKGGDIQSPHAHADLGSFVLDAHNQRFLLDLGPDHYDLPNFWNGRPNTNMLRWSLLRTSTAGHNTLHINDAGQHPLATAPISHFQSTGDVHTCTIDLSAAYAHQFISRLARTFHFHPQQKQIRLVDLITPHREVHVAAHFHTTAEIALAGNRAVLTLMGQRIEMSFTCPAPFDLDVQELQAAPGAKPLEHVCRLRFRTKLSTESAIECVINCEP